MRTGSGQGIIPRGPAGADPQAHRHRIPDGDHRLPLAVVLVETAASQHGHGHRAGPDRTGVTLRPVGVLASSARQRRTLPSNLNSGELRSWSRVASTTARMEPFGWRVSTTAFGGRAA